MSSWNQFGDAYDHPIYEGQPKTYLIATTPRSGSHYLGHLLFQSGEFGSPLEYFNPSHIAEWQRLLGADSTEDAVRLLFRRRTSPSGWFGVKAHWPHFASLLDDPKLFQLLDFAQYIRIQRRDTLAQAVSLAIAYQTGAWINFHTPHSEPRYSYRAVATALAEVRSQAEAWDRYFSSNHIAPILVDYDDLCADPVSVVSTVRSAFGLGTGNAAQAAPVLPAKQSSRLNRIWHERFLAECKANGDRRHLDFLTMRR